MVRAFWLHWVQSRQRKHLKSSVVWSGLPPYWQSLWHIAQFEHFWISSLRKKTENRLNIENIAPRGHKIRHHGRFTKKMAIKNITATVNFSRFGKVTFCPERACPAMFGTDASRAPAGHTLQINRGCVSPKKYGINKTIAIRTTYRSQEVHGGTSYFGVGTLAARSCKNPKGQAQPQISEPKSPPSRIRTPSAKKGNRCRALKLASTPIGQAKVARGHE